MGAQGTTTIDFGAFPGKTDTSVAVTGQTSIAGGSLVEAWVFPVATSDHSADEHLADPPRVMAGNIVAGTGFTIYGFVADQALPGGDEVDGNYTVTPTNNVRLYGQYTVAWVWN